MRSTSPSITVSADSSSNTVSATFSGDLHSIEHTLISNKYLLPTRISQALQGSIYKASKNGTAVVIKVIEKALHKDKVMYLNGQRLDVHEDIVQEHRILHYLTTSRGKAPAALAAYIDFFDDCCYYYLVQEYGGDNMFHFVKQCHNFIKRGILPLAVWHSFCRRAMQQMLSVVHWLHNTMNCCHLDVSLENFVICNVSVLQNASGDRILDFKNDFQIKIVDFGLAQVFAPSAKGLDVSASDFLYGKCVGKSAYQSPEEHQRRGMYDARRADVWSLGVCWFIMVVGCLPFYVASTSDRLYVAIVVNGQLTQLLRSWKKAHYVTPAFVDLLGKVLVNGKNRWNTAQIGKHVFLNTA